LIALTIRSNSFDINLALHAMRLLAIRIQLRNANIKRLGKRFVDDLGVVLEVFSLRVRPRLWRLPKSRRRPYRAGHQHHDPTAKDSWHGSLP
jgi:hypothetical protein